MELNDLLQGGGIDPEHTLVLRHRPTSPRLRKLLPFLAGEPRPNLFDAYQAHQTEVVERSILTEIDGWIASFIAYGPGKAIFVGIYKIAGARTVTFEEFWADPQQTKLKTIGSKGFEVEEGRVTTQLFDLQAMPLHAEWQGKLVVRWPPPERSWYRRAHRNVMPVLAIREESFFVAAVPQWDEVEFTWAELGALPASWRAALEQWRGVYLIWDALDGKSYVGSAYGAENILGRWNGYAATGHGGNKHLRSRDPANFRFTILQRVSPDLEDAEVIRLENSWKLRLHTRAPHGLNEN